MFIISVRDYVLWRGLLLRIKLDYQRVVGEHCNNKITTSTFSRIIFITLSYFGRFIGIIKKLLHLSIVSGKPKDDVICIIVHLINRTYLQHVLLGIIKRPGWKGKGGMNLPISG